MQQLDRDLALQLGVTRAIDIAEGAVAHQFQEVEPTRSYGDDTPAPQIASSDIVDAVGDCRWRAADGTAPQPASRMTIARALARRAASRRPRLVPRYGPAIFGTGAGCGEEARDPGRRRARSSASSPVKIAPVTSTTESTAWASAARFAFMTHYSSQPPSFFGASRPTESASFHEPAAALPSVPPHAPHCWRGKTKLGRQSRRSSRCSSIFMVTSAASRGFSRATAAS